MKRRLSWYWALPGMVGIGAVMAAALLLVTMGGGKTSTASAADGCVLVVTKTANEDTVAPGGTIVWTITVANTGTAACEGVAVHDTLDAATHCDSWSPTAEAVTGCSGVSGETVTWAIGTLPPNFATQTLHLTVGVSAADAGGDVIPNSIGSAGVVTTTEGASKDVTAASDSVTVVVPSTCDLTITKEANHDSLEWDGACWNDGDRGNWNDWNNWDGNLDYDITVTNTGTACTNPVITDDLESHGDVLGCDEASVVHVSTSAGVTCVVSACSDSLAEWSCTGTLVHNGTIELGLDAGLENEWADHNWDDEDSIVNTACVANSGTQEAADSDCATESVGIEHGRRCERREPTATPTAQPTPTATPQTPIIIIVQPTPQATPKATLAPPATGTGSGSGSSPWLPIGMGMGGVLMVALSGGAIVKKRMR